MAESDVTSIVGVCIVIGFFIFILGCIFFVSYSEKSRIIDRSKDKIDRLEDKIRDLDRDLERQKDKIQDHEIKIRYGK